MVFFRNDEDGEGEGVEETPQGATGERIVPLLPLRDIVVFPNHVVPLFVGRAKSIQALEDAVAGNRELMLSAQRQAGQDEPTEEDIAIEEAVQEAAAEDESADDGAAGEEAKGEDAPATDNGDEEKKDK